MESSQCIWVAAVFHLFGSNQENDPVIKLIVGAGEVLVFLLILVACGYVVYLGIRLWDKERARKMVQRVNEEQRPKGAFVISNSMPFPFSSSPNDDQRGGLGESGGDLRRPIYEATEP